LEKLPKQDLQQAFKAFRYDSAFFDKFLDYYFDPKIKTSCKDLDQQRCRVQIIYLYTIANLS
jgi:hypothetical protein